MRVLSTFFIIIRGVLFRDASKPVAWWPGTCLLHDTAPAGSGCCGELSHPHAVEGWTFTAMPATTAGATKAELDQAKDAPGVTSEGAEGLECHPGLLGVPQFTEKLTKMVTGAKGGPWPSRDGKAVEKLSLQDLYDLDKAVVSLNVISNPAVQECCNKIDEA